LAPTAVAFSLPLAYRALHPPRLDGTIKRFGAGIRLSRQRGPPTAGSLEAITPLATSGAAALRLTLMVHQAEAMANIEAEAVMWVALTSVPAS